MARRSRDAVFHRDFLIGLACFDPVEPGEGVGDVAEECTVDGFQWSAQNELGLDAAFPQAERRVDAECVIANAVGTNKQRSGERIAVEQNRQGAGSELDPPDETEFGEPCGDLTGKLGLDRRAVPRSFEKQEIIE